MQRTESGPSISLRVGCSGRARAPSAVQGDHCVELRVDLGDPLEVRLDDLDRGYLTGLGATCQFVSW